MKKEKYTHKRQNAIRELIQKSLVEDQSMLLSLLKEKYGIMTNQAAVSRDLRKLGVCKRVRGEQAAYELPTFDVIAEILQYIVKSVKHNESLIVINTLAGTADFVGDYLDQQKDLPILGTLAGENVVFVTPFSVKDVKKVAQDISQRIKIK